MVRICVKAPEIVMSGDVAITAGVSVSTKAKLESVSVKGDCECGDAPPPPRPRTPTPPPPPVDPDTTYYTDLEIVFLVDGSDSFDRTKIEGATELGGTKGGRTQFSECMAWCGDFITEELKSWAGQAVTTVVQFSGIKKLESSYEPDNDGSAFVDESVHLKHYQVEYGPIKLTNSEVNKQIGKDLAAVDPLDGNSQLFLAMQDMSSPVFFQRLDKLWSNRPADDEWTKRTKKRIMVIITDEEWDVSDLAAGKSLNESITSTGSLDESFETGRISRMSRASVPLLAGLKYSEMFAVIVRPSEKDSMEDLNEEFVVKSLCKGKPEHSCKVYADNFWAGMADARKKIANIIKKYPNGTTTKSASL